MQTATVDADASIVEDVWRALEADPHVDARAHPLTLAFEDGTLVMDGELADVAATTRAVELAQVFPEVRRVVDHLVVQAPVKMDDGEMRDLYRNALLGELAFEDCRLVVVAECVRDIVRDPAAPRGCLTANIAAGVITLEGEVPSLSHARLAGVLAWWIPGTRAVRNELRIDPPEEDSDEEVTDAVGSRSKPSPWSMPTSSPSARREDASPSPARCRATSSAASPSAMSGTCSASSMWTITLRSIRRNTVIRPTLRVRRKRFAVGGVTAPTRGGRRRYKTRRGVNQSVNMGALGSATPSFDARFASAPGLHLVLGPDPRLTIVAVNRAHASAMVMKCDEIVGPPRNDRRRTTHVHSTLPLRGGAS
jgi:hypothetical protein